MGPALVAASLLVVAGAQKVLRPAQASGALAALRLPSSSIIVRVGAVAEGAVGLAAITVGGPVAWGLVATSYLCFTAFVAAAMRAGTMIGTCGCFGHEETPPSAVHLVLNLLNGGIAVSAAVGLDEVPVEELIDRPGQAAAVLAVTAVAGALTYAAYVDLPRALAAGGARRRASVR